MSTQSSSSGDAAILRCAKGQGECKEDDLKEDVEELCLKVIADLQNIIVSTSPQRLAAKSEAEPQHGGMSDKLPQLELPTFDGQNVVQYKGLWTCS
ncbi:unnamed protein product [Euphydryas editha]|uniref:Uncharacterized protein n=1 Tax=Euphydryas editha TaxID=104508 RepID=A0AAU9UR00_EUPED|nr:unnamed protein product [Euphydryas editha]